MKNEENGAAQGRIFLITRKVESLAVPVIHMTVTEKRLTQQFI